MKTNIQYTSPQLEVIDIELSHNFFAGSTENLPGMGGENW
jgi:hypothetical protein